MKLSEIPREELELGTEVWNHKKTQTGKLVEILPEDREDISLRIVWADGKESIVWHFWCTNLEIIGA
jgi:hypothetical protein